MSTYNLAAILGGSVDPTYNNAALAGGSAIPVYNTAAMRGFGHRMYWPPTPEKYAAVKADFENEWKRIAAAVEEKTNKKPSKKVKNANSPYTAATMKRLWKKHLDNDAFNPDGSVVNPSHPPRLSLWKMAEGKYGDQLLNFIRKLKRESRVKSPYRQKTPYPGLAPMYKLSRLLKSDQAQLDLRLEAQKIARKQRRKELKEARDFLAKNLID